MPGQGAPRSQQQGPVAHRVQPAGGPGDPEGRELRGSGQGVLKPQPHPSLCDVTLGTNTSTSTVKRRRRGQRGGLHRTTTQSR